MIQNKSKFNCIRKKDNRKKKEISTKLSKQLPLESYSQAVSIHHHHFVYMYHVSRIINISKHYFCTICELKPAIMFIDHFYFQLLLKQKVSMDPGSMFCVHITGQNDWPTWTLSLSLSLKL